MSQETSKQSSGNTTSKPEQIKPQPPKAPDIKFENTYSRRPDGESIKR